MCDIWRDRRGLEISREEVEQLLPELLELQTEWVVLSGGEPLLHEGLFDLCDIFRGSGIRVTLLSTGQRLTELSHRVAYQTDETILSLDGPEPVHDAIRRVKGAYRNLFEGVQAVRQYRPDYPFSVRTTVQRENFRFLRQTLLAAKAAGLNSISFLSADVTSLAFNHPQGWSDAQRLQVTIPAEDLQELEAEIQSLVTEHADAVESGFIRESAEKLRRIVGHFRAQAGLAEPLAPQCNAPWVSAVVEADGTIRPCFFHKALGNFRKASLLEILNGEPALQFREGLDVNSNPTCRRCVCSLYREEARGYDE